MKRARCEPVMSTANKKPSVSFQLSYEQEDVLNAVVNLRKNVLVIAKAGSGKSSTALATAYHFHQRHGLRTMLITYNARLKTETRGRIAGLKIQSAVEAHSYHAVAGRYFARQHKGGADSSLISAALTKTPLVPLAFGLIVIDEAQDMNPLYYQFVKHVIAHCEAPPQVLIIGDPFQRIFGFNGATSKYLCRPEHYFGGEFVIKHLTVCWRITHEMAAYINENLNPNNLQHTCSAEWWEEHGAQVTAWWGAGIRANPHRAAAPRSVAVVRGWANKDTMREVRELFDLYGNDGVALLAFSLRGKRTPIKAIVDKLGKGQDENWAVLTGSTSATAEVLHGKRLASTVHRMKGLERRGVVVCGMGSFIEKRYLTDPLEHFNIWYVACTRAKDRLVVNVTGEDYATVRCTQLVMSPDGPSKMCEVTDLAAYVPFHPILSVPDQLFDIAVKFQLPNQQIPLTSDVCLVNGRSSGTLEDITPFFRRAVLLKLMWELHGQLLVPLAVSRRDFDEDMCDFVEHFTLNADTCWLDLVRYTIAQATVDSEYKHIWRQLANYTDVPEHVLTLCVNNTFKLLWQLAVTRDLPPKPHTRNRKIQARLLSKWVKLEVPINFGFFAPWFRRVYSPYLTGTADVVFDDDTVVGLACGTLVDAARGLELALLSSLFSLVHERDFHTYLIYTNLAQLVQLDVKQFQHDQVPQTFQLLHHALTRKLQVSTFEASVTQDYADHLARN